MTDIITLRSPSHEIGVVPKIGGGISHWRYHRPGTAFDVFRPAADAGIQIRDPLSLSCFPLLPYSNRIRNGRFSFKGRDVALPLNFGNHPHSIHGFGWQSEWQVMSQTDNNLTMSHAHNGTDGWPFVYFASQEIVIADDGIEVKLSVTNSGADDMPIGLGLHPYFADPHGAKLKATVDRVWMNDAQGMPTTLVGLPTHWDLPAGVPISGMACDNLFTNWRDQATITWPERRLALSINADDVLDNLLVYAPAGEEFFCVEPVSHITDAFNAASAGQASTGMRVLSAKETISTTVAFRLSEY